MPRAAARLFPWLCLREPRAQASSTSPRQACGPRSPPPQLRALSEALLFAAWSGKIPPRPRESSQSHPLRLQALERNGSVFPLHGGEEAGSRSGERGRGRPGSLSVRGSDLGLQPGSRAAPAWVVVEEGPWAAAGGLGHRGKESGCEVTSPGQAMGPDWHRESAVQMSRMKSDSRLDAPVSGAGDVPRGWGQTDAAAALPVGMRERHPTEPWPSSLGDGCDLTFPLPPNNLEEKIGTTQKFRKCQCGGGSGMFWNVP